MRALVFILIIFLFAACGQKTTSTNNALSNYFTYADTVESAGVKMIPINTQVGTFKVWTKRFGNNPTIKILLLHGGPAMTHEYMECFETFFERQGFEFSHASIMFNALKIKEVKNLVQVGIRDYCDEELQLINNSKGRVVTFFDRDIKHQQYIGDTWNEICDKIIANLPDKIYLSFDIDGLDPKLCPNTGTPVAGGFEAEQVLFLLEKVVKAGKKIIAFDLNEVAPGADGDDWDANVAARLLYRIANLVAHSN